MWEEMTDDSSAGHPTEEEACDVIMADAEIVEKLAVIPLSQRWDHSVKRCHPNEAEVFLSLAASRRPEREANLICRTLHSTKAM